MNLFCCRRFIFCRRFIAFFLAALFRCHRFSLFVAALFCCRSPVFLLPLHFVVATLLFSCCCSLCCHRFTFFLLLLIMLSPLYFFVTSLVFCCHLIGEGNIKWQEKIKRRQSNNKAAKKIWTGCVWPFWASVILITLIRRYTDINTLKNAQLFSLSICSQLCNSNKLFLYEGNIDFERDVILVPLSKKHVNKRRTYLCLYLERNSRRQQKYFSNIGENVRNN